MNDLRSLYKADYTYPPKLDRSFNVKQKYICENTDK